MGVAGGLAALLALSGCSQSPADVADPAPTQAAPRDGSTGALRDEIAVEDLPSDVDLGALDGTPVLRALAWLLDGLAHPEPPPGSVLEQVFADDFLAQVPAGQLRLVLAQLGGDYRITALEGGDARTFTGEVADDAGERLRVVLRVTDAEPPRIEALLFQPPLEDPVELATWEEAEAALAALADDVAFLAAEVDGTTCTPLATSRPDERQPVASTFKLYVLGALADAVTAGERAWDDTVVVSDALRSIPSGRLQDEPAGTAVPIAEAAELMIAISDNTATDLLVDLLGRTAVEDAQAAYGHGDPDRNRPLLTTREMAQLKWQEDDEVRQAYIDGDEETRRALLSTLADEDLDIDLGAVTTPVAPREIEWFASPSELCAALALLDARAAEPGMEPVGAALGANPIVRLGDAWVRSAAKGGSEPGVLTFAWLLERGDGQRRAFIVTLVAGAPIDEGAVIPVVEGALHLLAR